MSLVPWRSSSACIFCNRVLGLKLLFHPLDFLVRSAWALLAFLGFVDRALKSMIDFHTSRGAAFRSVTVRHQKCQDVHQAG